MKIVINACHGGFSLSEAGMLRYAEIKGTALYVIGHGLFTIYSLVPKDKREDQTHFRSWSLEERCASIARYEAQTLNIRKFERNDPVLVQVVQELGAKANGRHAMLNIVEIPNDVPWHIIRDFDGLEHVAENHRTWS